MSSKLSYYFRYATTMIDHHLLGPLPSWLKNNGTRWLPSPDLTSGCIECTWRTHDSMHGWATPHREKPPLHLRPGQLWTDEWLMSGFWTCTLCPFPFKCFALIQQKKDHFASAFLKYQLKSWACCIYQRIPYSGWPVYKHGHLPGDLLKHRLFFCA